MIPRPSPPRPRAALAALAAALVSALAAPADAHLMPPRQGTLNVVGDGVFGVASVPVSALHGFDDDGDGLLSAAELTRHEATLRAEIDARFAVYDGAAAGETATLDLVLSPQHDAATDRADQVVVLKHARFAGPPRDLRVTFDLFGRRPEDQEMTVTATRNQRTEVEAAVLLPGSSEARFFPPAPPLAVASAPAGSAPARVLGGAAGLLLIMAMAAGAIRRGTTPRPLSWLRRG